MQARVSRSALMVLSCAAFLWPLTAHAQVTLGVNGSQVQAISPYIYGTNDPSVVPNATFVRLGGNRWTAYNWTNNDSNAGSDYLFESDGLLSGSTTPGAAVLPTLQANTSKGAATLLTIPTNGYLAADRDHGGDIRYNGNTWNGSTWVSGTYNPNYLAQHFVQEFPNAAANTGNVPNAVYQDQFVNWVNTNAPNQTVFYDLDNEPDLWSSTHLEVHPANATYQEMVNTATTYGKAIKAVAPNALVFGAVNYGWQGMVALQNQATDPTINDTILNFQASYLKSMKAAEQANGGQRILDVLDTHFYPEAQGTNGVRITDGTNNDAPTVAARLQAARSLWDSSYIENSWITSSSLPYQPSGTPAPLKNNAIQLLNREQAIINEYYPGTKLSISEYEYGGGGNISGGVAEADVLGVYGQRGVFSAAWWGDGAPNDNFVTSAFNMYLNYDGHGSKFGNTSIGSSVSDASKASIYASEDAGNSNRIVMVLINKNTTSSQTATINLANLGQFSLADSYLLGPSSNIAHVNLLSGSPLTWTGGNSLSYLMPAESVTTLVLVKAQLGDVNLDGLVNNADLQALLGVLKNESAYDTAHNLTAANLALLADFNHDGVVDAGDIVPMEQFLTSGAAGGGSVDVVPEPTTITLLGLGGILWVAAGKRRQAAD